MTNNNDANPSNIGEWEGSFSFCIGSTNGYFFKLLVPIGGIHPHLEISMGDTLVADIGLNDEIIEELSQGLNKIGEVMSLAAKCQDLIYPPFPPKEHA